MTRNQRIFYACKAVCIMPTGESPTTAGTVHGLQSVGMSSTFTLEQIFEIGQLEIYENVEDIADIEVTLEKVIDGYKLIYNLASNGLCKTNLVSATKQRSDVYLAIYDDGVSDVGGETAKNVCWNSGMYISSVSYSYSVDGNATESVTLVGNDRFWNADANQTGTTASAEWTDAAVANLDGADTPLSGVVRRVDVDLENSTLPALVKEQRGDDPAGQGGSYHIQSVSVSTDFGQENILELGRFGPYFKYATFPVEVTCEFEVIATSGDLKSVSGVNKNLIDNDIVIKDTAGTVLNLGDASNGKNKLTSVSYSGGDTGGGNATVTYAYSNFNVLTVLDGGGA